MNTIPIAPETKNNYIYAITSWKNEYQLATISESQLTYQPFISQIYAKTYQAKVEWNYKWFLKYQSGSTQEGCVSYINLPSLLWNNEGIVDLLETENTQTVPYYIVNQWENLPYHPNNELWNIKPNNIIQFLRKNASAHLVTVCEEVLKELSEKSWTLDQNDEEILINFWAENPQNLKDKILPQSPISTVTYKSCDDIKHLESKTFWKTSSVNYWWTCEPWVDFICNNWVWEHDGEDKTNYPSLVQCVVGTPAFCSSTTINEYSLTQKNHWESQIVEKTDLSFLNWVKILSQNFVCNNGSYEISWSETWEVTACSIDYYKSNENCESVWIWYFSANDSIERMACSNKSNHSTYSTSWSGSNNCEYTCEEWYAGTSCAAKQKIITTAQHNSRTFNFDQFTLLYGTPQTKTSKPLTITGWTSSLTATFTLNSNGNDVALSNLSEAILCNTWYTAVWNQCKRYIVSYDSWRRWSDDTYATSCQGYKNPTWDYVYSWAVWDWIYWIHADMNPPFKVYCDMTTEGWGWTVITNSFANNAWDTTKPFNVNWSTISVNWVGDITNLSNNFHISMNKYLALANQNHQVEYVWYAKSGNASSPWQKTLQYSNHYLETDGYYTWKGSYVSWAKVVYPDKKLTTTDSDNDTHSGNCAAVYGSFGWYTACHDAHFWSNTEDITQACSPGSSYLLTNWDRDSGWRAVCNGYSNWWPDAGWAYNTWYQLKIMVR